MVLVIRTDWNDIGILKLSNCFKKKKKTSRTPLLEEENTPTENSQQREKARNSINTTAEAKIEPTQTKVKQTKVNKVCVYVYFNSGKQYL